MRVRFDTNVGRCKAVHDSGSLSRVYMPTSRLHISRAGKLRVPISSVETADPVILRASLKRLT